MFKKKATMPKRTEEILLTDVGVVVTGKAAKPGKKIRHMSESHRLVSDSTAPDGTRTIVIKKISQEEDAKFKKMKDELIKVIAEQNGEEASKSFKKLLEDVFSDNWRAHIVELHRMVVVDKQPAKVREGCFKIVIGDGRKKSSKEIMIRD